MPKPGTLEVRHLRMTSKAVLTVKTITLSETEGTKNTFLELSHPSQTFRVFLHSSLEKATRALTNCSLAGRGKKKA